MLETNVLKLIEAQETERQTFVDRVRTWTKVRVKPATPGYVRDVLEDWCDRTVGVWNYESATSNFDDRPFADFWFADARCVTPFIAKFGGEIVQDGAE